MEVTVLDTKDGNGALKVKATGTAPGDYLLCCCDSDNGDPYPSAPEGWETLASATGDATWDRVRIFGRPAADGEYTFNLVGGADGSVILALVSGDGPIKALAGNGANNSLVAPSLEAPGAALLVNYWLHWGSSAPALTPPGGTTWLNNHQSNGWARRLGAYEEVGAGATGTRTATSAVNTVAALSVLLTEYEPTPEVVRVGAGSVIATDGSAPGANGVHASTAVGDLLIWHWYSRTTGTNEVVSWPEGWTQMFQYRDTSGGLIACAWRIRKEGDSTYTATRSNHATGSSGETILTWIETFRGHDPDAPIGGVSSSASIWGSSTTLGAITPEGVGDVPVGGMLGVFAGRKENVTGQTVLSGDGLSWATGTNANTSEGSDAGAVTQHGTNKGEAPTTPTNKSITTTGTAQTGKGAMYRINPEPASPASSAKVWNGSEWVSAPRRIWTGSEWVEA